jgi:carbohydrate-selective porin OprB
MGNFAQESMHETTIPVQAAKFSVYSLICRVGLGLLGFSAIASQGAANENTAPLTRWLSGDGITGTWAGVRPKMLDRGIELFASYDSEVWGNTSGGLESGTVYTGVLEFGLNLDLGKAIGWQGGSFSTKWLWLSGRNASEDLVGNFLTISNNAGFNTLRNYELWFQQNLLDDKISIRLGQLAADTEFVISDYAAIFLNGTFGWPAFMYMNLPQGGQATRWEPWGCDWQLSQSSGSDSRPRSSKAMFMRRM